MMIIYEELGPWGGNFCWTEAAFAFPHWQPKEEININPGGALAPIQ